MLDLYSVGMERGLLYETIVTTRNPDGTPNAAPIGVVCKNATEVVVYLHQGSQTFENVKREKSFGVNILRDPMIFVESTVGNLDNTKFEPYLDYFSIKGTEAFFTVQVTREKLVQRQDHLGTSTVNVVTASVGELVKNQEHVHSLNRAIYGIIEALIYLSRIDMVSEEEKKEYLAKLGETSRVVNKVGSKEHKKAMKKILEYLRE